MDSDRASFENVRMWVAKARDHRGDDVMIVLVGNKIDNEENRKVSLEEGVNLAKELGLDESLFIETSAKTGVNVK